MNADQIGGGLIILIAAAMSAIAWIYGTRKQPIHPRRAHIDVLTETALIEGAELDETFDARLLPLSDSEVASRIRKQIDENTAVRQLRADLENWSA